MSGESFEGFKERCIEKLRLEDESILIRRSRVPFLNFTFSKDAFPKGAFSMSKLIAIYLLLNMFWVLLVGAPVFVLLHIAFSWSLKRSAVGIAGLFLVLLGYHLHVIKNALVSDAEFFVITHRNRLLHELCHIKLHRNLLLKPKRYSLWLWFWLNVELDLETLYYMEEIGHEPRSVWDRLESSLLKGFEKVGRAARVLPLRAG